MEVIEGFENGKVGIRNNSFDAAHLAHRELALDERAR